MTDISTLASVDNGKRIIDQPASTINPEDMIMIDSVANGTRSISYEALCAAVKSTLEIEDLKDTADKAMPIATYDANYNGIVDNAEKLGGHLPNYFGDAETLKSTTETANSALQKETLIYSDDEISKLFDEIFDESASEPVNLTFMTDSELNTMWDEIVEGSK